MTSKTLIVSFAGHGLINERPRIEFASFLKQHFPHMDAQFYMDSNCKSYHFGMEGISTNIDETVQFLKRQIDGYERIVFLGASAGGYAAILFGSLLNVDTVIAFIPQTIIRSKTSDERYRNLRTIINTTTKYYIIGDQSIEDRNNYHHISHCENIATFNNVLIKRMQGVKLSALRDSGQLYTIVNNILNHDDEMFLSGPKEVDNQSILSNKFHFIQRYLPSRYRM